MPVNTTAFNLQLMQEQLASLMGTAAVLEEIIATRNFEAEADNLAIAFASRYTSIPIDGPTFQGLKTMLVNCMYFGAGLPR